MAKPTSANTVPEIKAYLDSQGIPYTSSMSKTELLALIV
ncbi:Ish1 domain-containing protein [Streptococcus suis]